MKKLLFTVVLLLCPALVFAQPSIVFEAETHDFGVVEKGGALEFSFEFRNQGTEDLKISRVAPS
jgi:hypothetical protein